MKFAFLLALVLMLLPVAAKPATYEVVTRNDIVFAEHDGVELLADLYSPKDFDAAPVLVGVHAAALAQLGRLSDPARICARSRPHHRTLSRRCAD